MPFFQLESPIPPFFFAYQPICKTLCDSIFGLPLFTDTPNDAASNRRPASAHHDDQLPTVLCSCFPKNGVHV
jgi:hypothetical protein